MKYPSWLGATAATALIAESTTSGTFSIEICPISLLISVAAEVTVSTIDSLELEELNLADPNRLAPNDPPKDEVTPARGRAWVKILALLLVLIIGDLKKG